MRKESHQALSGPSLPILPGYAKGANMEEQDPHPSFLAHPLLTGRSKNMRKLSSGHEVENSAWQSGIESSGFRELSTGGPDETHPACVFADIING